jgi:DNA-binding LytR/AlgR family response regulator
MNKVREIIPWFNDTYILTVENCLEKEIPVSRHFIQSFKTFLNL